MAELFLELLSEEIPARMQARASEDLRRLVTDKLKAAGLAFTSASAYATPRRLALTVDGLPLAQPDVTEEKRGPRVGAPEQAIQGFLKSAGLASLDQCEKHDTGKGEFWFAVLRRKGRPTGSVLGQIIFDTIWTFPWPKSMRWADYDLMWVRPVKSVVALFDGKVIDDEFSLRRIVLSAEGLQDITSKLDARLRYGNVTRGHRFLDPREIKVAGFADYKTKLREGYVIIDPAERRATIWEQAERLAASAGLSVKPDDALLDEVTGLVEWPVALMGRIDEQFMDIPPEVLTTSMRVNQKYFSLLDNSRKLAPRFVVVANIETKDDDKAIVAGNERVLRARLSDAKFFWDQDRKVKLEERVKLLARMVFHAKLGSMSEKASRLRRLVSMISAPGTEIDRVRRAALLAKADLTTEVVGEFPELQGIMGRYYALEDQEDEAVSNAIAEHYWPKGLGDDCPKAPVSRAVALADRLDSLVGFFAIGEAPSGTKDPFGLRRAAIGAIRIIVENGLRISLKSAVFSSYEQYTKSDERITLMFRKDEAAERKGEVTFFLDKGLRLDDEYDSTILMKSVKMTLPIKGDSPVLEAEVMSRLRPHQAVIADLLSFFADRLKVTLREKGVRHDLISAVFALGGEDDLVRLLARVDALKRFLDSEDGGNLLVAYRRASNIVRIEEKKDGKTYNSGVDGAQLRQEEEKALHRALAASGEASARALESEDFAGAMGALAELRAPVDAFFDKVTVNCDETDLRANRLRLLSEIRAALNRVADFSQIEG